MGLKELINDCCIGTENMGSAAAAAKEQFPIGEDTSGQSITTLVRLALLDQMALMRLPAVHIQWYSRQFEGNSISVYTFNKIMEAMNNVHCKLIVNDLRVARVGLPEQNLCVLS